MRLPWMLLSLALATTHVRAAPAEPTAEEREATRSLIREAFQERRFEDARALLEGPAKEGDLEALHWLGRVEFAEGRADEALEIFDELCEEQPDRADSHFWYGRACHLKISQVSKLFQIKWARRMRTAFERAHELDPEDSKPRVALIRFHREAPGLVGGDDELAWTGARELARLDPSVGEPLLADMLSAVGEHAEAAEAFRRALAVSPDERGLHHRLAIELADAGRAEESFAAIDAWTEREGDDPIATYLVGRTAAVSGKELGRGRAALQKYLEGGPHRGGPSLAVVHWRLGSINEHAGDREAARASYRKALKLDPELKRAKQSLKALGKP